jgi:malto-oligosyltrehalose trehalohydrolase
MGRHVHLVLEHDGNIADHLRHGYDAQWNDDAHHALHVLLTGEGDGYYSDYARTPAQHLARCLAEGFAYQGEASAYRKGETRGTPSADLPPTAFVLFLQNHDQVGNRPLGDRLTAIAHPEALKAAITLLLLAPNIPLLFMGEERMSGAPFQFFTDFQGELAAAVRDGRRKEFAGFTRFSGEDVPDPNAVETFERSKVPPTGDDGFHRTLLKVREKEIVPRLAGTKSIEAMPIGDAAVTARWRLGDGTVLAMAANFDEQPCRIAPPRGKCLFSSREGALDGQRLAGRSTVVFLEAAP